MAAAGKRAGSRRGPKPPRRLNLAALGYAVGITASVVAWGYLVYLAIDFGSAARGGRPEAWAYLAMASLGAVLCLFLGLLLVARLLRALGITGPPDSADPSDPSGPPPRIPGGRRAAR